MKNTLLMMLLGIIAILQPLPSEAKVTSEYHGDFTIGSIVYSLLGPSDFFKLNDKGDWMQIGGGASSQIPTDSELCAQMKLKEPGNNCLIKDFSGQFIRISGGKAGHVGEVQPQSTARPQNDFSVTIDSNGTHQHRMGGGSRGGNTAGTTFAQGYCNSNLTEASGGHTHSATLNGGDKETKPSNIALYAYLRVNEKSSPKHHIKDLEERVVKAEKELKLLKRRELPSLLKGNTDEFITFYKTLIKDFDEERYFISHNEMSRITSILQDAICSDGDIDKETLGIFEEFLGRYGAAEFVCYGGRIHEN